MNALAAVRLHDEGKHEGIADGPDLYLIGENTRPIKTTKTLALAAYNVDLVSEPYRDGEWLLALALGTVMLEMLRAGMVDYHEMETPVGAPSIFAAQLLQAYQQLRNGSGDLERKFRETFFKSYKHFLRDVCDIRGDKTRERDAAMLVRVVRTFCPWPDTVNEFERAVYAEDTAILHRFVYYYTWVLMPALRGHALVPGRNRHRDGTNRAWRLIEQEGSVVKITFWPRWKWRPQRIVFVGEIGDRAGSSFRIVESTLPADKAIAVIDSFNERATDDAMILDLRARALGDQGYIITRHPKTGRPVLVDTRGLKI